MEKYYTRHAAKTYFGIPFKEEGRFKQRLKENRFDIAFGVFAVSVIFPNLIKIGAENSEALPLVYLSALITTAALAKVYTNAFEGIIDTAIGTNLNDKRTHFKPKWPSSNINHPPIAQPW